MYIRRRICNRFINEEKFVEELQWLDEDEMLDVTAITQSAPGPLPVNASVIIGYRMAGILGSLSAVFRHNIASHDCTFNHISVL